MKIKKYPQSHLVITNDLGKKLIIDPGYLSFQQGQFKISDFQGADLYLITHQHADHLDPQTIKEVVGSSPVYGNLDVINKLKEVGVGQGIAVKNRENFEVAGFMIEAVDLPHFKKPGVEMPPNTGFLIRQLADGIFFHPGDGWRLQGVSAEGAAIPISSPEGGELGFEQGLALAKSLGAKVVIPIHYDTTPKDPQEFSKLAQQEGIRVIVLSNGQETTI